MSVGPKTTLMQQRSTSTSDGMGGYSLAWADVKARKGVYAVLNDRERMMYGKKAEGAQYKFILDDVFGHDITTSDRFENCGRIFEIIGKENPMNQDHFSIFFLKEFVDG